MVLVSLKCPYCRSENVSKNGHSNGKQRYSCNNPECVHKTFYAEYTYNGWKLEVKRDIIKKSPFAQWRYFFYNVNYHILEEYSWKVKNHANQHHGMVRLP